MDTPPVHPHGDGTVVAVRVVPGASRAAVVGMQGEELKVRVCSPPVDGRANEELCAVLAEVLGVRRREVEVVAGHAARSKRCAVALEPATVRARLAAWIGHSGAGER